MENINKKTIGLPKFRDLKVIPKDETVEAVIIDLVLKTWQDITKDEEKKKKLKNPEDQVLIVKYDAGGFIRNETFPLSDNPTTSSRYGRFCLKYNPDGDSEWEPYIGMQIKVLFDDEGQSSILLKK